MQEVKSQMLSHVGYNEATQVLSVRFHNGKTYNYPGVSADEHKALMAAESIGKHFAVNIKNRFVGQKAA